MVGQRMSDWNDAYASGANVPNDQMVAQIIETIDVRADRSWGDRPALRAEDVVPKLLGGNHIGSIRGQGETVAGGSRLTGIGSFQQQLCSRPGLQSVHGQEDVRPNDAQRSDGRSMNLSRRVPASPCAS